MKRRQRGTISGICQHCGWEVCGCPGRPGTPQRVDYSSMSVLHLSLDDEPEDWSLGIGLLEAMVEEDPDSFDARNMPPPPPPRMCPGIP